MIVSIHQPNYLPWSGFFHKMSMCDQFVLLDNVPFSKNSYQNRCKIKTSQGTNKWLTVPVLMSGHFGQATNLVQIDKRSRWASKHWRTIKQNYSRAPFFDVLAECIKSVYHADWDLLGDLNVELITRIAKVLRIATPLVRATSIGVEGRRSDLLYSICQSLGASEYLSGPSGRNYLDVQVFTAHGIKVTYHSFTPPTYPQLYGDFIPGLSVSDLLANCGPASQDLVVGQGGKSSV